MSRRLYWAKVLAWDRLLTLPPFSDRNLDYVYQSVRVTVSYRHAATR
jgi:hypothetical protein